ncbi:MAG: hypothetical protein ACR2PF_20765 [Rhizobiaceae bacterium]
MVEWRGKSAGELSRAELQYALEDAVAALISQKRTVHAESLYWGLLGGLFSGGFLTALCVGIALSL